MVTSSRSPRVVIVVVRDACWCEPRTCHVVAVFLPTCAVALVVTVALRGDPAVMRPATVVWPVVPHITVTVREECCVRVVTVIVVRVVA